MFKNGPMMPRSPAIADHADRVSSRALPLRELRKRMQPDRSRLHGWLPKRALYAVLFLYLLHSVFLVVEHGFGKRLFTIHPNVG